MRPELQRFHRGLSGVVPGAHGAAGGRLNFLSPRGCCRRRAASIAVPAPHQSRAFQCGGEAGQHARLHVGCADLAQRCVERAQELREVVPGGARRLRRRVGARLRRAQGGEPRAPFVGAEDAAAAGLEDRSRQALAFAVDVEVIARRHRLRSDRGEDGGELRLVDRRVDGELQQQVARVRDAVAPAFLRVEAAIVAHRCEIGCGRANQAGALLTGKVRLEAVDARDFRQGERRERLPEPGRVDRLGPQLRQQREAQRLQRRRPQQPGAHPVRKRLEGQVVAQRLVGRGEAVGERDRERLAARVVGDAPLGRFHGLQRRLRRGCRRARGRRADARTEQQRCGTGSCDLPQAASPSRVGLLRRISLSLGGTGKLSQDST